MCVCVCSMEFQYLNEVPVLTLDVNDDFKDNSIKCGDLIEKVWNTHIKLCFFKNMGNERSPGTINIIVCARTQTVKLI